MSDSMLEVFNEMHRLKNENEQLRIALEQQSVRLDALLSKVTEEAQLTRRLPEVFERVSVSVDTAWLGALGEREQRNALDPSSQPQPLSKDSLRLTARQGRVRHTQRRAVA